MFLKLHCKDCQALKLLVSQPGSVKFFLQWICLQSVHFTVLHSFVQLLLIMAKKLAGSAGIYHDRPSSSSFYCHFSGFSCFLLLVESGNKLEKYGIFWVTIICLENILTLSTFP